MHTKSISSIAPLFRSTECPSGVATLLFDDQPITAPAGVSIAAALLLSGAGPVRTTPVTSAPRAPYCMMGVCFDCLVEVDGVPNRQSCMVAIRDGMVVKPQRGASSLLLTSEGEDGGR